MTHGVMDLEKELNGVKQMEDGVTIMISSQRVVGRNMKIPHVALLLDAVGELIHGHNPIVK